MSPQNMPAAPDVKYATRSGSVDMENAGKVGRVEESHFELVRRGSRRLSSGEDSVRREAVSEGRV